MSNQIKFLNIPRSDSVEAEIQKKIERLEQLYGSLSRCQITIDKVGKHSNHGKQYEVRIDIGALGRNIAVSHGHGHDDVYAAISDAFKAVEKQLQAIAA